MLEGLPHTRVVTDNTKLLHDGLYISRHLVRCLNLSHVSPYERKIGGCQIDLRY